MTSAPEPSSEDVRKQGNDLYKAGNFLAATECYRRAAELAPSEAAPLSDISAAYYELGDYGACYTTAASALELRSYGTEPARQKLYLRQVRSSIYDRKLDQARKVVGQLSPGKDRTALEECIWAYKRSMNLMPDSKAAHTKIVLELPRYKPQV